MAPSVDATGTFERVFEFEHESVPVMLFRCRETGLRLALAKVMSPTVHGYFALQTEAFDDCGLPHTLEHLIFLGSERYPYKGVLDVLANRCLAQGTNAWTDTDHTCYTVDTAGSEGFLRILPVYLDHVLFPTLKDSGFVTEVHHINGEGSNAGVVYCEMQARENEAGDMVDRAMKLAAYPGRCSYKSETGGRLKELRELTNKMVCDYHREYYRPENLCVIVTGQVDPAEFCRAVAPVVEAIKGSQNIKSLPPYVRPFAGEIPKPSSAVQTKLDFPAEDEKTGAVVKLSWHGPGWESLETIVALEVLLAFMTKDAVAPLRKALVETEPPFCGGVGFSMLEQTVYLMYISLKSVDMEQLSKRDIDAEATKVLEVFAADSGAGIDMERMRSVIKQLRRAHVSSMESSPHDFFCGELIGSFLYAADFHPTEKPKGSSTGDALRKRLDKPATLDKLIDWPATRWAELCREWLLSSSNPRITVVGTPSKKCGERIQEEDDTRTKAQKAKLGEEGCKAAGEAVDKAEEENDVDTPDEVAQKFQLPDMAQIRPIGVSTVTGEGAASASSSEGASTEVGTFTEVFGEEAGKLKAMLEGAEVPLPVSSKIQLDHVAGAQFVDCEVLIPLQRLSTKELEVLPIWFDVAFSLPLSASDDGPSMTHEEAVHAIDDVSVSKGCSIGRGGGRFTPGQAANMLHFHMKVEKAKYAEAPRWLARLLADVVFDAERLRIAAKRILNDIPNTKRSGKTLMALALRALRHPDGGAASTLNAFRMEKVLGQLLKGKGIEKAIATLSAIRTRLLAAPKLLRVAGDVAGLGGGAAALEPWRRSAFDASATGKARQTPRPSLAREEFKKGALKVKKGVTVGCLLSSSAEESNYWRVQTECITDPRSPEHAPLMVAIEYLVALEGPFWRKLRGKGLSYSYSLRNSCESGLITFGLFEATDPTAAAFQAAQIVRRLCGLEVQEPSQANKGDAKGKKEDAATEHEEEDDDEEDDEEEDEAGLDPMALEAAQSGIIFELIGGVETVPSAMDQAFGDALARVPPDQLQWLLKEVQGVSAEAVQAAMTKYILPLFDGSRGRVVSLVCPAKKRKQVQAELKKMKPPFKVVHLGVEEFVKTLGPEDGFSALRARVLGGDLKSERTSKGGSAASAERRVDPQDGMAYTWEELVQYYKRTYQQRAIEAYWASACWIADGAKTGGAERRVDPIDGVPYTFEELSTYYRGQYSKAELRSYWDSSCAPAAGARASGKAKAKAKAKTKAKGSSR